MDKRLLYRVGNPFVMGFHYGKRFGKVFTPREAEQGIIFNTSQELDIFLNGMEDGARGDRWRLDQIVKQGARRDFAV